ncbi:hypothetical protein VTO42DRAFT_1468 [Malbranchea cinnamomea]
MAKPRFPLTPASSTEIAAMDNGGPSPSELYFSLPPAAIPNTTTTTQSKQRAGTKRSASEISLPPPPTRTRKIIQMKPKEQQDQDQSRTSSGSGKSRDNTNASNTPPSKKKHNSATTAAGRKIARKTAHSLIERRRRSKMNEEFATLKNMIPACRGQDMHKLAILQASIEYMNYLERCIAKLKATNQRRHSTPLCEFTARDRSPTDACQPTALTTPEPSPVQHAMSPTKQCLPHQNYQDTPAEQSRRPTLDVPPMVLPSPALHPHGEYALPRQGAAEFNRTLPPLSVSTTTSPMILPEAQNQPTPITPLSSSSSSSASSSSSSQRPDVDMDHEASTALLMLTSVDRRKEGAISQKHARTGESRAGLSVHDLLTH